MKTVWNPVGGQELMIVDSLLEEPLPDCPVTVPSGNRLPDFVPYRYRGGDFREPPEIDVTVATPAIHPKVREATALDDPALRYARCPVSRPRGWGDR